MIEYSSIYKKGKITNFFIKIDKNEEFEFIQPYFIVTDLNHTRKGSIKRMDCLFSNAVWEGEQTHGWGYSGSHEIFLTIIYDIILKIYDKKLTEKAKKELKKINTHDNKIKISNATLKELRILNDEALEEKWKRG